MLVGMSKLLGRYRRRGAHRAVRPGPLPPRPASDPWGAHGIIIDSYSPVRWEI
jgi:hypothetical protein